MRFVGTLLALLAFSGNAITLSAQEGRLAPAQIPVFPQTGYFMQAGFNDRPLPEGVNYNPVIFSAVYRKPLTRKNKRWVTAVDIQPQIGWASSLSTYGYNFEFGINVGFSELLHLGKGHYLVATIGSGPHYTNVATSRQATGFIFSDNWLLNYSFPMKITGKLVDVSFILGFRHISNAGLKSPNGGLNNFIVGVSVLSR